MCELILQSVGTYCVSCRAQDEWSTLAVNCLEQFAHSTEILNVIQSRSSNTLTGMDKIHTFQLLVDCCSRLASSHGALWPECYSTLLVELYRLLITDNKERLLYAVQLGIILLPRNTAIHLRHLLLFMHSASSSTQVLLSTKASIKSVFCYRWHSALILCSFV